jgi:hypothetical protein
MGITGDHEKLDAAISRARQFMDLGIPENWYGVEGMLAK